MSKSYSQSELYQSGHELRPDLHTALEPGSEILQDLKLSKYSSQSELFQAGQELKLHLHIGQLPQTLEFSILQPHRTLSEILCQ